MAHPAQRRWYPIAFAVALLVLLPLSVLLLSWHEVDRQIWAHLWQTQMLRLLGNTLVLVLGVGVGVTLLGVSLAWGVAYYLFVGFWEGIGKTGMLPAVVAVWIPHLAVVWWSVKALRRTP